VGDSWTYRQEYGGRIWTTLHEVTRISGLGRQKRYVLETRPTVDRPWIPTPERQVETLFVASKRELRVLDLGLVRIHGAWGLKRRNPPPMFPWPLVDGKQTASAVSECVRCRGLQRSVIRIGVDTVRVPAGSFKGFRIESQLLHWAKNEEQGDAEPLWSTSEWYSPEVRNVVKSLGSVAGEDPSVLTAFKAAKA
jgi:hypothetical protein